MATPTEHAAAVGAFIIRTNAPHLTPPTDMEMLAAQVHAHLSTASGAGESYTNAEACLTAAETVPEWSRRSRLLLALVYAIRADR
ncbi:hypothetical protein AB0N64_06275 [Microbacterium sp. NPDC089318]